MDSSSSTAKGLLPAVLSLLMLCASEAGHSSYCQIWQADIRKSDLGVRTSRNYKGLWISEKCEIQPGPHFTVRRYHLLRSGHFSLIRYHYRDPWCTRPSHSIWASGTLDPPPEQAPASWVVPGAIEMDYALRKVVIVPFTRASARELEGKVNASCPGRVAHRWRPFKKYRVLSYDGRNTRKAKYRSDPEIIDCSRGLGLRFNELQLSRLEHRIPIHLVGSHRRLYSSSNEEAVRRYQSYLYLGADGFPTGSRPTYYQVPLIPSQTEQCSMCHVLSKATATSPPVLPTPFSPGHPPPPQLEGRWISLRCEVRPFGLFLHRSLSFHPDDSTWSARHAYFKDPSCRDPMFTLTAAGSFAPGRASTAVPGAREYDFRVLDTQIAGGFAPCGGTGNLTAAGGCPELGIAVPSLELDLVRRERDLLYLGQSTEDGRRPVSFQPPLVQCDVEEDLVEVYNELHPLPLTSAAAAVAGSGLWIALVGLIL